MAKTKIAPRTYEHKNGEGPSRFQQYCPFPHVIDYLKKNEITVPLEKRKGRHRMNHEVFATSIAYLVKRQLAWTKIYEMTDPRNSHATNDMIQTEVNKIFL